jgi:hypothetical protein
MIAHGENALQVNMTDMTQFVSLIENLMLDLIINIETCEKNKTFTK